VLIVQRLLFTPLPPTQNNAPALELVPRRLFSAAGNETSDLGGELARTLRRIVVGAAVALLAVAALVLPQQASASAEATAAEPEVLKKTFTMKMPGSGTAIVPVPDGDGASTAADPPGGPCYYGVQLDITAWYVEGILSWTDNYFNGQIDCLTTGPDQNMTRLTSIAKLYHFADLKAEDVSECWHVFSSDPPCFQVFNWGFYQCWGQLNCTGDWRAGYHQSILLPPDWGWEQPTDPRCSRTNSNRELVCIGTNDPLYVPPTY
jgi:hypothetical protein